MNKYQLYTLGGALLAATSLAGTAAQASTGYYSSGAFTAKAKILSNLAISPTAATANTQTITGTGTKLGIAFSNSYAKGFNLNVTVGIAGATFVGTPTVSLLVRDSHNVGGTILGTVIAGSTGVNTAFQVSALSNNLFLNNLGITSTGTVLANGVAGNSADQVAGFLLDNVTFANAAGLATAGSSISLSATVANQASLSQIFETVASGPVITSAAPLAVSVNPGTTSQANASAPTPFSTLSSPVNGSLSIILASVGITSTGALATDLTTIINADGQPINTATAGAGSGSVSLQISSPVLTDGAAATLSVVKKAKSVTDTTVFKAGSPTVTTAAFSSGSISFTLAQTTYTYQGTTYVTLQYNGTTGISAEGAGTLLASFTAAGSDSLAAPGSVSGVTTTVTHGVALSTQVDWATDAASGLPSYLRIHNNGAAGPAFVVLQQDSMSGGTVTKLGTYTSSTVPAGGTIQVGVPTIEAALGVTANASNVYTLLITAPFAGYVQHLQLTPNNTLVDLDGFRNGGAAAP